MSRSIIPDYKLTNVYQVAVACLGSTAVCPTGLCMRVGAQVTKGLRSPGFFVSLRLAGRLLPGLGSLAGFSAKSDLLGKFAALFGIFRSHHRVILRQPPFFSILLR